MIIEMSDQSIKNEQGYMVCRWFTAHDIEWINGPYGHVVGTGSTQWRALVDLNNEMVKRHFDRKGHNLDYFYGVAA